MKKLLALFLAMAMLVTVMPMTVLADGEAPSLTRINMLGITSTYAANTSKTSGSDFTEMPTITAFGTGVAGGDKLFGETVATPATYSEGDDISGKLADGYYFTYGETKWSDLKGVYVDGVVKDAATFTNAPADSTANMIKFTQAGSGIDFKWTAAQTVARLNLWAWPADAIDGYEIYIKKSANGNWALAKTGSLNYGISTTASTTNSTFYQIILDKPISSVYALRFKITSFVKDEEGNDKAAYITEAVPRSTNEINLTSYDPQGSINFPEGTNPYAKQSYSIYVDRATYGNDNDSQTPRSNYTNTTSHRLHGWIQSVTYPELGTNISGAPTFFKSTKVDTNGENTHPYYAVDFGTAKHRINCIKFTTHSASSEVTGFQLWCTDNDATFAAAKEGTFDEGWTKVYDNDDKDYQDKTTKTYKIQNAPEARYWKFVVKANNGKIVMTRNGVAMYSLSEYELDNTVSGYASGDDYRLNDNVRFTLPEWRNVYAPIYGSYPDASAANNKEYFLKFGEADTGIEWKFDEEKTVNKVNLWTWPAYAIGDYTLEYKEDGEWKEAKKGNFNYGNSIGPIDTSSYDASVTYWNSIVLDEEIKTTDLRFTIKGLTDASTGAYIAEADVLSTNGNLISTQSASNDGKSYSIYPQACKTSSATPSNPYPWRGWPSSQDGGTIYNVSADSNGNLFYAVRFMGTHHAINRIVLNVASGKINEFEVYCSNESSAFSDAASDNGWTKVATVKGSYTGSFTCDIKDAPACEYWKIKVTDFEDGTTLSPSALYELGSSYITTAAVSGKVSDGNVIVSLDKLNTFFEGKKAGEAKVYFALYSGRSLVDLEIVDVNLNDTNNGALYTIYNIPDNISGTPTLKAFVWNGTTLEPLSTDISFE